MRAREKETPMKNYDRINALPPKDIERKKAHIIGGGIAGFATAAFLIDDAHMPGEKGTRVRDIETVDKGKETLATGPAKTGVIQPLLKNAFTTFKEASWVPPRWSFGPSSRW